MAISCPRNIRKDLDLIFLIKDLMRSRFRSINDLLNGCQKVLDEVLGLILRVNDDVIMNFSGSTTKECRLYDAYPWCGLAYPWPKLIQVVDSGKFLNHTEYMYLRYDLRSSKNEHKISCLKNSTLANGADGKVYLR